MSFKRVHTHFRPIVKSCNFRKCYPHGDKNGTLCIEGEMAILTELSWFLVADTQLYKRLCPSVRWLVGRLVGPSVRHARVDNAKNAYYDAAAGIVCECAGGRLGVWLR